MTHSIVLTLAIGDNETTAIVCSSGVTKISVTIPAHRSRKALEYAIRELQSQFDQIANARGLE